MSPRLPPAGLGELGAVNWVLCRVIALAQGVPEAHLFTTLGRQRGLFRSWLLYSARLMPGGSLSRKETELVILRIAHLRDCQYERDHHVKLGRRVGITAALLQAIEVGPSSEELNERQRAILAAVDDLVRTKNISDANWRSLRQHLQSPQIVELCLLVGQYETLATTIATLGIQRDF
ncbi:MAG: carboxymuconolactone decarboxylase family protein [Myxococcales bacterium]